jgi:hypothetical protein
MDDGAEQRPLSRDDRGRWIIRCACGHTAVLPGTTPTSARVRCSACGRRCRLREAVGSRPPRYRHRTGRRSEAEAKRAAAQDLLRRLGDPQLDDDVPDLGGRGT